MKLIMMRMKFLKKMEKKFQLFLDLSVEWVEEESFFFKLSSWENKIT